ncbi:MAG TPA: AP2 domain-containing protein [Opitutaceae bacterium]
MRHAAFRTTPTDRNSSGRIGVFRRVRSDGRHVWMANWMDPDTNKNRRAEFSVHRYGEDGAREQAERKRVEMERILAQRFGSPGVTVQRIMGTRVDGWQVRWREPVSDGVVPASIFFGSKKHGGEASAKEAADALAAQVRNRLGFPAA